MVTWIPRIEENDNRLMVKVCDDLGPSLQCHSDVSMVLANRKVGWDGDAQPEIWRPLCSSLRLKLAKTITWSKYRDKCQWYAVGTGNFSRQFYSQCESIPPAKQGIHTRQLQLLAVVVFSRLLTGEFHLRNLHVLHDARVDTERGGRAEWCQAWRVSRGRSASYNPRNRAVEPRWRPAMCAVSVVIQLGNWIVDSFRTYLLRSRSSVAMIIRRQALSEQRMIDT